MPIQSLDAPPPHLSSGPRRCVVDTPSGTHLVYHRKLHGEPGWADRTLPDGPFLCDAEIVAE